MPEFVVIFVLKGNLCQKIFKQVVNVLIAVKAIIQSDIGILLFISSIQTSLKFPFY